MFTRLNGIADIFDASAKMKRVIGTFQQIYFLQFFLFLANLLKSGFICETNLSQGIETENTLHRRSEHLDSQRA